MNGALKRARSALSSRIPRDALSQAPLPGSAAERQVVDQFTDAFERGDVAALVAMLTDDAWLTMPPWPLSFRGKAAAERLLAVAVFRGGARRFRLVPTRANGQPAFACFAIDAAEADGPAGMIVLALAGTQICGVTRFLDSALLPRFGVLAAPPR